MSYTGYNKRQKIKDAQGNIIAKGGTLTMGFGEKRGGALQFRYLPNIYNIVPAISPTNNVITVDLYGCSLNENTTFQIQDCEINFAYYVHQGHWLLTLTVLDIEGLKDVTINNGSSVVFPNYWNVKNGDLIMLDETFLNNPEFVNVLENGGLQFTGAQAMTGQLPLKFQLEWRYNPNGLLSNKFALFYLKKRIDNSTIYNFSVGSVTNNYALPRILRRDEDSIKIYQNGDLVANIPYTSDELYVQFSMQGGRVDDFYLTQLL